MIENNNLKRKGEGLTRYKEDAYVRRRFSVILTVFPTQPKPTFLIHSVYLFIHIDIYKYIYIFFFMFMLKFCDNDRQHKSDCFINNY